MALKPPLIDVPTADLYLPIGIFPEWNALSTPDKEYFIQQASDFVRVTWSCVDEDFATPTLSEDAERAVSYYSEASRAGNLYDDVSDAPAVSGTGALTRSTLKAGSLEKTEEFSEGVTAGGAANPLRNANDIFSELGCTSEGGGTRCLSRV